jgi:hypothetical protein
MSATTLTAIPPQVPSLQSITDRVEAGMAKEPVYARKHAEALLSQEKLEPETFTVRHKDIARLQLCDRGLRAVSALMPVGQGNQRHIVELSGQRAFVATQKMRNLIGAMKADYDPLWSICEAKAKIAKHVLSPKIRDRLPELIELEKKKLAVKDKYGKKDPNREAQLTRLEQKITSQTREILAQATGVKQSRLEKLATKLPKLAKALAKAESEWAQMHAGLSVEKIEENLTKRFLALVTFGAGNCGDYAEAGFYLITHGFLGDIPPDTPIYQLELAFDHNVIVIGELNDNPIILDGWAIAPTAHRLSESNFKDCFESPMTYTVINHHPANTPLRTPFSEEVVTTVNDTLTGNYKDAIAADAVTINQAVADADKTMWNHMVSTEYPVVTYKTESESLSFRPYLPPRVAPVIQDVATSMRGDP